MNLSPVNILDEVQSIIRVELDQPTARITHATVADDLPDWDSIAHVRIIVAIENRFGIIFDIEEYTEFADVGEMIACIERRLSEKDRQAGRV
jgi:acyl carrier protein